jgi:hypothetical protein
MEHFTLHGREPRDRAGRGAVRGRWGRGAAALTVVAALAAAGCSGSPRPPQAPVGPPPGLSTRSGVSGGALFGGDVPLLSQAGNLGRKLAIVRVYYHLGEQFPLPRDSQLMAAGTTLLVSLDSVPGRGPSYASIAAGQYDRLFRNFLTRMEQSAVRYHLSAIYFTFEHEANAPRHLVLGSPAEFVRAWDHVHQLARSARLDWNQGGRLHWVLILTHVAYEPAASRPAWAQNAGQASSFWPGSNAVDIVGADGYNSGSCRNANRGGMDVASGSQTVTPEQLFSSLIAFARSRGNLPVFIPEWGSVPYAGSAEQATFIGQMQAFVAAHRDVAAALYWNSSPPGFSCDYSLNSQPASVSALRTMARSAALQGHLASS